jgi:hypothetical protein
MTDYTKTTDFTSKDSLPSGDSGKIIRGAEFGTEFDNIQTAVNSKSNKENPSFTGNITVTGTVDGRDIATDGTKLDTIETSADVTDTANVTAAGALMDSEVTNLAQVKAFDSSDYATAAQGTTADNALPKAGGAMTGAITTNSTFDGRDVATDGTKLDGIEALADVTDTTNVTNAGALMDSELTDLTAVKSLDQGVATTDTPTFAGLATSANVTFGDNDKAIFGAGDDLQIYHSGSASHITDSGTGNLLIQGTDVRLQNAGATANYLKGTDGAEVSLFYAGGEKLATSSSGIDITGNANFADNGKASFGTDSDMSLFHNGNNAFLDNDTGTLFIQTDSFSVKNATGTESLMLGTADGAVTLYHNNAAKLATTATGIDVTGSGIFTTADNSAQVTLISTDTDALAGPQLNLWRNSGTGTNGDLIGQITFTGEDTVGSTNTFATIYGVADQTNNGAEDGSIHFQTLINGVLADRLEINNAGNSVFTGNVGIGTSSPAYKLDIYGSSSSNVDVLHLLNENVTLGNSVGVMFENYSGSGLNQGRIKYLNSGANNSNSFVFEQEINGSNGLQETMRLDSSGNLLVNGTNATAKMVVDGDANAYTARFNSSATTGQAFGTRVRAGTNSSDYALLVENTSAASMLAVRGDGNVGIGTSTPQASIHTTGDAIIGTTTSGASYEGVLQIADGAVNERTVVLIYNNHPDQFMKLGQDVNTAFIGRDNADEFAIGLFDNAADTTLSKQFVIDASGNVLVGKTSADNETQGVRIYPTGRQSIVSEADTALLINRRTSDGSLVSFRKDATQVGSIGVVNTNNLRIGGTVADHAGIQFGTNILIPESGGSAVDGSVDLGYASGRFKDLHLSGGVRGTSTIDITIPETSGGAINLEFGNNTNATRRTVQAYKDNFEPAAVDTGVISLGQAGNKWKDLYLSGVAYSDSVLVGTTSTTDSAKFSVLSSGTAASFRTTPTTATSLIIFRNGNGLVGSISTNGSATSFNTSSDQRLKDNIVDAPSASNDIDAIQVRSFDWKADGSHQKYGMVAQELQNVAPEAVSEGETEDDMLGVDYSKLVPMLVKEIQSLRARVAQLETN